MRFRVEAEEWHDQIPDAPDDQDSAAVMERKPPYSIIVGFLLLSPLPLHQKEKKRYVRMTSLELTADKKMLNRDLCRLRVWDSLLGGHKDILCMTRWDLSGKGD